MEEAFNSLYNKYLNDVRNIVRNYEHNKQAQEDLVQEVFLKVWQSVDDFREESKVGTWIHKIAINTAKNWVRDVSRRVPLDGVDPEQAEALAEAVKLHDIDSPEEIAVAQQTAADLQEELMAMPSGLREAFILHHTGSTYNEIADEMQCTNELARQRVSRAKQRLMDA